MTQHRLLLLPLAALVLGLAACSGPRIVRSDLGMMYSTGELFAAADGRDLRTVVQGNLFGAPGFDQRVTEIMTATYIGPRTRFTTTPGPTENRNYFVSVVFNAQPAVNPFNLCDKKTWTTAPAMRPIVVRAAFCILGREQSAVTGYLNQATGLDDPNFTALVHDLTVQLFPYVLPVPFGRPDFG